METVEHQLFFCQNATRLTLFYSQIFGETFDDFFEVIRCSSSAEQEIVKYVLLKLLLQLDGSAFLDLSSVKQSIICYLLIEISAICNKPGVWNAW